MSGNCVASLALIVSLLPLLGQCQSGNPCPSVVGEPSCVCNHPDGLGRIDATSLGSEAADAPKFVISYSYVLLLLLLLFDIPPTQHPQRLF